MPKPRPLLALPSIALLCQLASCSSSSDDGGPPPDEVTDQLGRTCLIEDAANVTCDEDPQPAAGCPEGATPCFDLGTTGDASGPGAICAACCGKDISVSMAFDCSNLTCSTDDDCPAIYGRCLRGECLY